MQARQILPLGVLLLLVAIRLPVLATPFLEDDLHQLAYLAGSEPHPFSFQGGLDLFRFFDGDAAAARSRIEQGALPWRTDEVQKVAFLRPLASGLMWIDYTLFGLSSLPAHLHSLLWFVAFAFAVRALYTRLLPRNAGIVALLACLMSSASLQTLRWWSARNALLAVLFATWCLYFYLDWWDSGRLSRLAATLLFLLLSLLSAESGIAILAFPLAHVLVEGRGSPSRVVRRLTPLLIFGAGYLVVRGALGYGISSNALYLNPFTEPVAYVEMMLPRLHQALAIVFLNHVSENPWVVVPLLVAMVILIVSRLRGGDGQAKLVGWLTAGSLLSLSVSFASRSSLRPWTMLIPQLGAHAVLGLVVASIWSARAARVGLLARGRRWLAAGLVAVCLGAPLYRHWTTATDVIRKRGVHSSAARASQFPDVVRQSFEDSARLAVFLNSPYQVRTSGYLALLHGMDVAPDLATLTVSDNPFAGGNYALTRTGPASFRLSSDAPLMRRNDLYRFDQRRPLAAGRTISGDGFRVTVDSMRDDAVAALSVELDLDLDDPEVLLLEWADGRYWLVEPPPIGETISLSGSRLQVAQRNDLAADGLKKGARPGCCILTRDTG